MKKMEIAYAIVCGELVLFFLLACIFGKGW
jgi:hypothetical protein